jgi:hypothetical protein
MKDERLRIKDWVECSGEKKKEKEKRKKKTKEIRVFTAWVGYGFLGCTYSEGEQPKCSVKQRVK